MARHNFNAPVDDSPTTALYLPGIISSTSCDTHLANVGSPCFSHENLVLPRRHDGICNARAKSAGFNGSINPTSLDRSIGRRPRG